MDETYKLIWENYPVTVMGQTDADRRFHTRAVGIATIGTERVGRFYLQSWKLKVPSFAPRAFLGDAAQAFANAALSVFPTVDIRLMCYAHVYKV